MINLNRAIVDFLNKISTKYLPSSTQFVYVLFKPSAYLYRFITQNGIIYQIRTVGPNQFVLDSISDVNNHFSSNGYKALPS